MEQPGLRVQPRGSGVVRDFDLGSETRQLVERAQLGAVRVRRRDEPKRLAVPTVATERIEHRVDSAQPNERHHDVDRVGRVDLGAKLVTDGRLPTRVRQERRVEQRRQRRFERLGGAVRPAPQDRGQHAGGIERHVDVTVDRFALLGQQLDELLDDARAGLGATLLGKRLDRPGHDCGEVARKAICRLGVGELLDLRSNRRFEERARRRTSAPVRSASYTPGSSCGSDTARKSAAESRQATAFPRVVLSVTTYLLSPARAREDLCMDATEPVVLRLTVSDAELLIESLDSHEYWQIGDILPWKDGQVFIPGDMEPDLVWEDDVPTAAQRTAIDAVERCRALAARLGNALKAGPPVDL